MERIGIEECGEPTGGALLLDRPAPPLELLDEDLWEALPPATTARCPALSARNERTVAQMPRRRYRLLRGMVSHLHCDGPCTLAELGWEGYADVPVLVLPDLRPIGNPRARRESTRIARLALHFGLVQLLPLGQYAASASAGDWLEELRRRDMARWERNHKREEMQQRSGGGNHPLASSIELLHALLYDCAVVHLGNRPRLVRPSGDGRPVWRRLIRWAIREGVLSQTPGGGPLTLHFAAAQHRYDELAIHTTLACLAGHDDEQVVERGLELALAQGLVASNGRDQEVVTRAGRAWLEEQSRAKVTHVFAVPGQHYVIDEVNPKTGRSMVNGHTLEQVQACNPGAVLVAWVEWARERAAEQDTPVKWTEVNEERYDEMLNVLPPVNLAHDGFQVGEPQDHHVVSGQPRFDSYKIEGGKHYVASRPMTSAEFRSRKSLPTTAK